MRTVIEENGLQWTDYTGGKKSEHTLPTFSIVGDGKVCYICRSVSQYIFEIRDRQPDVECYPLVEGIRDGRDELLEKAVEIIEEP